MEFRRSWRIDLLLADDCRIHDREYRLAGRDSARSNNFGRDAVLLAVGTHVGFRELGVEERVDVERPGPRVATCPEQVEVEDQVRRGLEDLETQWRLGLR